MRELTYAEALREVSSSKGEIPSRKGPPTIFEADEYPKHGTTAESLAALKPAFDKIWKAVGDKQAFETRQIKTLFRSPEAKKDMEAVVKSSQVEFDRLAAALQATIKPVDSTLKVEEVR